MLQENMFDFSLLAMQGEGVTILQINIRVKQ